MKTAREVVDNILKEELNNVPKENRDVIANRIINDLRLSEVSFLSENDIHSSFNIAVHMH